VGKAGQKPVADAISAIQPNVRCAPLDVLLVCDAERVRRARIRFFQLPELAPSISCAIAYEGVPFSLAVPAAPPMLDSNGLLARVRDDLRHPERATDVAVSFVDVSGLDAPGEAHQRAAARIEAVLQSASIDGASAARLAPERFAVMRAPDADGDLSTEVQEASAAEGLNLTVQTSEIALSKDTPTGPTIRALRFALEACIREGGLEDTGSAFTENLTRTLKEADRFRAIVRDRDFKLEYQPIVDLASGATHHFEALARFGTRPPAASIHLAEELGLIEGFDLAVAEKVLRQLRRPGFGLTRVAVNVSGASLGADTYVQGLLQMTAMAPDIRRRLLVEVTETAAVADIEAATRRLKVLRDSGIKVCLDDFGVGAASLDYLHRLPADTVKIDGRFVRDVATDSRSQALIGHLVGLCTELKLDVIAEMIENGDQSEAVRKLGVSYGQGWFFGRPASEPVSAAGWQDLPVRRRGEVAAWG
jgi:EAL domain-containing protein (putative c-di-GMP-specific phosphodiesterase class I)